MKKPLIQIVTGIVLLFSPKPNFAQAPDLRSAADFVIFSSNGAVKNTGNSNFTGNIGTNIGANTGFGNVNGVMHQADSVTTLCAGDLLSAFNTLNALTPAFFPAPLLGNGDTLNPGVYSVSANTTLNQTLTLNAKGNANAVFIFKIAGTFSSNASAKVNLINGAQASNVFWKTEGAVNFAAGTAMKGTVIAHNAAITLGKGVLLDGRALSTAGAVTVNGVTATVPQGSASPALTGPAAPALASAMSYTLFSGNGAVVNTGITLVKGDVGTNVGGTVGYDSLKVNGTIHPVPDGSTAICATDVSNAYNYLNALTPDIELLYPALFGDKLTLTPHTYLLNTAAALSDTLYLNALGNANAVFVIKVNGALSTSTYAKVILTGGAREGNVFWVVDGAVNLNDNTDFKGTIVCNGAINLNEGTVLSGRAFTTNGALNSNEITAVMPTKSSTSHAPVITSNGGGSSATIYVREDSLSVTTVTATDAENNLITYSISGGADQAKFRINSSTGVLTFIAAPDYENPSDFDRDNIYNFIIRATDNSVNALFSEQTISVIVTNVEEDTTAPIVTGVTNNSVYNINKVISFNEGIATLNGANFATGSTVSANGTYTLVVTDAAGNRTTVSFEIDKTDPVVTGVTNNSVYNINRVISFNEGTAALNGANFANGSTVSANGTYTLVVTDAAGNSTTVSFEIDKTAPVVTGVTNNSVYNINKVISFNEGTAALNGANFATGSTVSANGTYTLVVTDAAGNRTTVSFEIDKTAPVVTGVTNNSVYNINKVISFNEGTAALNGANFANGSTVSANGTYTLVVTDAAGNRTTVSFEIDKTAPVVTGVTNNSVYNINKVISFNEGTAALNGANFANGLTVSANGTYTLVVTDAAGNSTTVSFEIDKTTPVVTGVINNSTYREKVTISFNEGTATLNGSPFVSGSTVTAKGTYHLTVTDKAGNVTPVDFIIVASITITDVKMGDCANDRVRVSYSSNEVFNSGNIFRLELSDSSGRFNSPLVIGFSAGTKGDSLTGKLPAHLFESSKYRIRVSGTNPVITGTEWGQPLTIHDRPKAEKILGRDNVNTGMPYIYTVPFHDGSAWQWLTQASFAQTGNVAKMNWIAPQDKQPLEVIETNRYGCVGDTSKATITVFNLSIEDVTISSLNPCPAGDLTITAKISGIYNKDVNEFKAELSNASGSFDKPTIIGKIRFSSTGKDKMINIPAMLPYLVKNGNGYRVRVVANSPKIISNDNGRDIVINKPNISNKLVRKCAGLSEDLTALYNVSGLTTEWSTQTPSNVTEPGIYTVIVTNENGCKDTATVEVKDFDKPQLGKDTVVKVTSGTAVNITSFFNLSDYSIKWNTPFPKAVTQTGRYRLVATNGGCRDTAFIKVIFTNALPMLRGSENSVFAVQSETPITIAQGATDSAVNLNRYKFSLPSNSLNGKLDAVVFPNPAKSIARLQVSGSIKNYSVTISDLSGKELWKSINITVRELSLPVERLSKGVYIVTVNNGIEIKSLRLLKE